MALIRGWLHIGVNQISQYFKRSTGARFLTVGEEGTNIERGKTRRNYGVGKLVVFCHVYINMEI